MNFYFGKGTYFLKMNDEFKKKLQKTYESNFQWNKIRTKIKVRVDQNDISDEMNFILKKNIIYYAFLKKTLRLCISWKLEKEVFKIVHDINHHCEFHRVYVRVSKTIYIRHFSNRLRRYIRHCQQCLKKQTVKHASYEKFASIKIMTLSFHTITIDFIVALSETDGMNVVLITIDKFFKKINMISNKTTWSVSKWIAFWLNALQKEKWKLSRTIFSDRNKKFVVVFWKMILLFIIAYHFQANGQSERTNQTLKIALKYAFMKKTCKNFIKLFSFI